MDDADGERVGVLVLRAWVENQQQLRVRITRAVGRTEPKVAAASNIVGTCAIVQAWLEDVLDGSERLRPF
jgi:hypothetical protein